MVADKNKQPVQDSFWQAVLQRRVLQIIGIYIAVGWGIVQFVDWIVNRYVLSPHLIDLALIILLSLLPSMLIVAYFHGRPGRDKWTRVEKLTIPLNLVITAIILIIFSSGKDLGAAQKKITMKNESGEQVEKLIPKHQFRKKVAVFYFENVSGDKKLDWLQQAVPHIIQYDLRQDLFLETKSLSDGKPNTIGYPYYNMAKEAGYPLGLNIPLGFKKKIAEEMHKKHFLCGTFNKVKDKWVVETILYKTRNAGKVAGRKFEDANIFTLVDKVTIQLKEDLEIPAGHIKEVDDLPVAEMFTKSFEAFRLFTLSRNAMVFRNNWKEAKTYIEKALKMDPDFAFAYDALTYIYLMTSQLDKWIESHGPLMKHLHKLPERDQLFAKVSFYQTKQDVVKQFAILKMIIQMYPQDMDAYTVSAALYGLYRKPDEAIATYQKMLEIDPTRHEVHKPMGIQYQVKGDQSQALKHLEKYAENFPKRAESYTLIGDLKAKMGQFEESKNYYEKAVLLSPQEMKVQLKIAENELNLGYLDRAQQKYFQLLETCQTDKDKARVHLGLIGYYEMTGQMNKALEYTKLRLATMEKYTPPVLMLQFHLLSVDSYLKAGKVKEAQTLVDKLKKSLPAPLNEQALAMEFPILLETASAEELEKMLPVFETKGKIFGKETHQLIMSLTRARIAEIRKQYGEARHRYNEILKANPASSEMKRKIAFSLRMENKKNEAEGILIKLSGIQPFDPQINLDLSELYWQMGKKELALKHLKTAVKVWQDADLNYEPAQKAKKLVTEWQL